ncbi:MAG: integrase domain-containing protein, partial [Desulfuromonadales bacterium]
MKRSKSKQIVVGKSLGRLEFQARFVVGKLRRGSSLTRKDQLNCLGRIGKAMERYGLNSIKDMKTSHIVRLFAELKNDNGLSEGRLGNFATAIRMLCRMMGKIDIVPSNRVLGCARNIANRTKHADKRLDTTKAAEVVTKLSTNNLIAYNMALHFGLRQKEALLSFRTVIIDGIERLIVEGAKGGRPRTIAIVTAEQKAVLSANQEYRANHGGLLIDEDKSLKQGIRQLQNQLASAGASRGCGNMHSARREYIIVQCLEIL